MLDPGHDLAPRLAIGVRAVGAVQGDDVGSGGGECGCIGEGRGNAELAAAIAFLDSDDGKCGIEPNGANIFG